MYHKHMRQPLISGALKAHRVEQQKKQREQVALQESIDKLEAALALLRDKRDENKSETAALKSKKELFVLKYNKLRPLAMLRDLQGAYVVAGEARALGGVPTATCSQWEPTAVAARRGHLSGWTAAR